MRQNFYYNEADILPNNIRFQGTIYTEMLPEVFNMNKQDADKYIFEYLDKIFGFSKYRTNMLISDSHIDLDYGD